jgi:hypothetical protein
MAVCQNTWTSSKTALSGARSQIAGGFFGDIIVFAGGRNSFGDTAIVDIYNCTSATWAVSTLPSGARSGAVAVGVNGYVLITPGINNVLPTVDVFVTATYTWFSVNLNTPRRMVCLVSSGWVGFFYSFVDFCFFIPF